MSGFYWVDALGLRDGAKSVLGIPARPIAS